MTTVIVSGMIAALAALATAALRIPIRPPRHQSVLTRPPTEELAMNMTVWPIGWPHEAPDRPFSVADAHRVMQGHRGCQRDECLRKRAAYDTLVGAGHIKPDSARAR